MIKADFVGGGRLWRIGGSGIAFRRDGVSSRTCPSARQLVHRRSLPHQPFASQRASQ